MANEIKTRIQLKYDTYANWNTSNEETQKKHTHGDFVLKAGEIGIAKLVSDTTIPLDRQKNAPVLFKVGDDTHAFKDLPWTSALAADVYAWAKAASVGYNTTSGEIEFKDAKGAIIQHFKTGYTDTEIDNKIKAVQDAIDDKDVGITGVSASGDGVVILNATTENGVTTITGAHDKRYDKNHGAGSTIEVAPQFGASATADLVVPVVDACGHITKFNDYSLQITLPALPEDKDSKTVVAAGVGIDVSSAVVGDTTTYTVDAQLQNKTTQAKVVAQAFDTTTEKDATRHYAVGMDKDGNLAVSVPWIDTDTDTVTKLEATDQYINVSLKDTAFNDDGLNEYTIQLNLDKVKELIGAQTTAAMEFKGATATLPENPAKGDMWKVAGADISIEIDGVAAKTGDSIVYEGTKWYLIPSGDDIEDTWRPVKVGNNTLETNEALEFVAGDHVDISEKDGKVTIAAEDSTYELKAEALADGAKLLLDGLGADVEDSYVNLKDDNVVNVTYSEDSNEKTIKFSHADKNANAYTATGVTQTKTAAFGETVSFNIDTVNVDKKGHATAAQGTVNITLPALPEEKTYDLSVHGAGDVYVGYGSTVGLTLSHDYTPVYLQGKGAGEENTKGDIDITYDSSDSSGSLVETITFDINRVRTSKLYDDTYDAKEKTTTLIFNCGSASEVL